jgi:hypothetical protein
MFLSVLLHALLMGLLLASGPLRASDSPPAQPAAWFDVTPQPAPTPAKPAEPPAHPPEPPPRSKAPKQPRSIPKLRPAHVPHVAQGGVPDGQGTLAIPEGTGAGGPIGTGPGPEQVDESDAPEEAAEPPPDTTRAPRPAQLSIWLDPKQLEHIALVRPGTAVLMSIPGFRDMLRGSSIRPFSDLERLRITLTDVAPEKLTIAGVHVEGEQALRDAARHVAAMRQQEPVWRGDSSLQATSWVDGSGVDRGLAIHDGAFLIGARESLPAMLSSSSTEDRVDGLSRLRKRVILSLAIEDAARYLPSLPACGLEALRVSVATTGRGQRLSVRAEFETASAARDAPKCLRALGEAAAPLSRLVAWLTQAEVVAGSFSTQYNAGVTSGEIQELLDELAWALRNAGRA